MNIGRAIKLCRNQKGFTKTKLAENSGLSVSYLTLLEQGKRDPNLSTLEKICLAFTNSINGFNVFGSRCR